MMIRIAVIALLAIVSFAWQAVAQSVAQTTNASAVIATGNTFQTVLAAVTANNQRRSLTIQNNNASDACWVYVGAGSATKGTAIALAAGQSYTRYYPYVPSDAIQATCATTSDTLYIDTQ